MPSILMRSSSCFFIKFMGTCVSGHPSFLLTLLPLLLKPSLCRVVSGMLSSKKQTTAHTHNYTSKMKMGCWAPFVRTTGNHAWHQFRIAHYLPGVPHPFSISSTWTPSTLQNNLHPPNLYLHRRYREFKRTCYVQGWCAGAHSLHLYYVCPLSLSPRLPSPFFPSPCLPST